jgi:hypothetical protein
MLEDKNESNKINNVSQGGKTRLVTDLLKNLTKA